MKLKGTFGIGIVAAGLAALASPAVAAPNLVVNGGFESTTTTTQPGFGWTVDGAFFSEGFDYLVDTNPADAHSGTHSFAGGAIGGLGTLSQSIPTLGGRFYNIDFSLANLSGFSGGTAVEVRWGGNVVYSATDIPGFGYGPFHINALATSPNTALSIGLQDDSFFLNIDDVSVSVPEPTSLALLLGALGAAAASRRRRMQS